MRALLLAAFAAATGAGAAACAAPLRMPQLATARIVEDYDTYEILRVGVMPFAGHELSAAEATELQAALQAELAKATSLELVALAPEDLAEIESSEPHRRGWYRPRTIIELARRYSLDGIVFGTVVQRRFFPPQLLDLQADLVSAETGLVLWSATVQLDAADPRVREGLRAYYGGSRGRKGTPSWELGLLSPERFARFAAFQLARLLRAS